MSNDPQQEFMEVIGSFVANPSLEIHSCEVRTERKYCSIEDHLSNRWEWEYVVSFDSLHDKRAEGRAESLVEAFEIAKAEAMQWLDLPVPVDQLD